MANYNAVRLTPTHSDNYPPGSLDYFRDTKVNAFIGLNEEFAEELEDAREKEDNLLTNLQTNYLKSTLPKNIDGQSTYKFTNMLNATDAQDYITFGQLSTLYPPPVITQANFNLDFTQPYAEYIVDDIDNFNIFEYNTTALPTAFDVRYPSKLNATFIHNWFTGGTDNLVDLDHVNAPKPIEGDRLRFIFIQAEVDDGIQAADSNIQGLTEKITFGENYDSVIYDLVFTGQGTGWLFKNVIIGAIT